VVVSYNVQYISPLFDCFTHRYGLKTGFPVDVVQDDGCAAMPIVDGLYFLRSADSIASFEKDGDTYIITANEGDDVEYGDFEEKVKGEDIFINGADLGFTGWTADADVLEQAKYFNAACEETDPDTPWCSSSMRFSIGSSMVDYSDPQAPNVYRLVGIGGRGITIYKVTDTGLEEVWDSAKDVPHSPGATMVFRTKSLLLSTVHSTIR
jgi:hypothetical protein